MAESPNSATKSRLSSSKAKNVARSAELELSKTSLDATRQAITTLEALVKDASFRRLQIDERIGIYHTLASAYGRLQAFKEQEVLIVELLQDEAFKPYWISLKATLANSCLAQENLIGASKIMKELLRNPKRRLSSEDAAIVATLHTQLERHTENMLKLAESKFCLKEYTEACRIYQYLWEAANAGAFPRSYSKVNFEKFLDSLASRLVTCYIQKNDSEQMKKAFWLLSDRKLLETNYASFEQIINYFLQVEQSELASQFLEIALLQILDADLIENSHWLYTFSSSCSARKNLSQSLEKPLWLCEQFLQKYPDSQFFPAVLLQKGLLLWQADAQNEALKAFSVLEADYPHAAERDTVLFFMGSLLQSKNEDARPYFSELYTDYPSSPYAPEAYYRMFTEQLYASGDTQAIGHLKKMPKSYLSSPYGVLAAFYVAAFDLEECPQKSLSTAQTKALGETALALTSAITTGKNISTHLPPKMQSLFILRILQAEYHLAQCHFAQANLNEAIYECSQLKQDIFLLPQDLRPHELWQKAAFLKSRLHLLQGNALEAREELTNLLEYATSSQYSKGEPLVLALIDVANLEARDGNFEQAFALLNKAQVVQANEGKEELLLEILIAKSQLHRNTGELDKAMMLLSSVINESSASSLRIQAMYLRAELYELKGRRDLAFRQLQTTAKKGGEWGAMAAKKLEEKYGYE